MLLIRIDGERQGVAERLAFWIESRAPEVIRGPGGWRVGDAVMVKMIIVRRASHEDLRDGRELEMLHECERYGADTARIREELREELLAHLELKTNPPPVQPACAPPQLELAF